MFDFCFSFLHQLVAVFFFSQKRRRRFMSNSCAHKKKRQHSESMAARSKRHSAPKSIFGEIDQTKEYIIYWLCDSVNTSSNHSEMPNVKLRGIADYLKKISDVNTIREANDQNIFLIMDCLSLHEHFSYLITSDKIRLIYIHEDYDSGEGEKNQNDRSLQCPKVSRVMNDLFNNINADCYLLIDFSCLINIAEN